MTQFNSIETFKDSISQQKSIKDYYKNATQVKSFVTNTYRDKARTTQPSKRADINRSKSRNDQNVALPGQDSILSAGQPSVDRNVRT